MMSRNPGERHRSIGVVCVCISTMALAARVDAQSALLNHPVFAKYPSAEDLQRRVNEFKQIHMQEYRAALNHFDSAVRSNLELEWPRIRPQRRVIRKWPLRLPLLRVRYLEMINGFESSSDSDSQQWAAFYRMHIDDFSVKYTPALRIVALDVFLSGWDDWSRWTSKRLQGYRERYPDIYRIAAVYFIRAVQRYESEERTTRGEAAPAQDPLDHTGVFLRKLIDPHISYKLRGRVAGTVGWIRNDIDALDFVVKAYLATDDEGIRYQCLGVCGRLNQTISKDERLAFWLSYVNTPDRKLRGMAIGGIGNSRRRPRDVPLAEHPDRELVELLRRVASTDPDEQIRRYALDAIKSLVDDSPPPGLIDYSKPQGRK